MAEVTDISPAKANSTSKPRSTHTVPLKSIHSQKVLKNEDLPQYKYTPGELKAPERLQFCRDPRAAEVIMHFACHLSFLFPWS